MPKNPDTLSLTAHLINAEYPIDPNADPTQIAASTEALQLSRKKSSATVILPREYDPQWVLDHARDAEQLALAQLRPRTPELHPPSDPELKQIFWSNPASVIRFNASSPEEKAQYRGVYSPIDLEAIEAHVGAVCRQLSLPIQSTPWPQIFEEARAIIKR